LNKKLAFLGQGPKYIYKMSEVKSVFAIFSMQWSSEMQGRLIISKNVKNSQIAAP